MDQDDSMLTSPSSPGDEAYDDDNLFPDPSSNAAAFGRPQTPQNDHLNAAAPGELSPPRSQSVNTTAGAGAGAAQTSRGAGGTGANMVDDEDLSPTAANRTVMPRSDEEEWKPGQGWKSKKAQEDMQRAWDAVVDKDFGLKEFGDVMAQRMGK